MDACFFKEKICDELGDAKAYIKKAIELKPTNTAWSKLFVDMSTAELAHAKNFYNMYTDYHKTLSDAYGDKLPEYLKTIHEEIVDEYTECWALVKHMHEMY